MTANRTKLTNDMVTAPWCHTIEQIYIPIDQLMSPIFSIMLSTEFGRKKLPFSKSRYNMGGSFGPWTTDADKYFCIIKKKQGGNVISLFFYERTLYENR